jgi:PmbA protein
MPKISQSLEGFSFSRSQFEQLIEDTLAFAKKHGATSADAIVNEGTGLNVSVRKGELENVERSRDKSLDVTVYLGQRSGSAGTSDFSKSALQQTVRAAYDIARFTAEDPASGLPDSADLATKSQAQRDLQLFHPWHIDAEKAYAMALLCENAAFSVDPRISNSDGASVGTQQSQFWMGNSLGFRGGYASSRHSLSVSPIAASLGKHSGDMQRDSWSTSMRCADHLAAPEVVGRYAAQRALSQLKSRKIKTCEVPVLFESTMATGLLGAYVQATRGRAIYTKTSFLLDSLGKQVFPSHISIAEDPHQPQGKGSSPFDMEGVRTQARDVLKNGIVQNYFLSSYAARKLGMRTTGHAGGSHNLALTSSLTQANDDLPAMLRKLHRGLFVIDLMGQGVNYVTGDYSRGASGFWVENGAIAYPVHEITIAGNLRDMFLDIQAVGHDVYNMGSKTIGSVLVGRMKVAGS